MSRQALDKTLRAALEKTVIKAREVAELAATEVVERLGVGEANAPTYLDEAEVQLRKKLRAHGRQLGDALSSGSEKSGSSKGEQETRWLIREIAYSHWHRMLFARFLEQNNLLMYDAHTPVTLDECAELAEDDGYADAWEMAAVLAAKMLPQVFRPDSPVYGVHLAINHIRTLEDMIGALDPETFQAQDSLGWVYQFWQNKRKEEVNKSEVKIGAKELSPVTQLFTEPYMVSFLLDNALGAWWANRRLTDNDKQTANTEAELRQRASIEGVPLEYLRFVKTNTEGEADEGGEWTPAAGTFDQWPSHLSELNTLDPCCGSGHFLVAAFLMLVPMRMADEELSAQTAVDAVLSQNIHGLELDQRCVELAAFALALEAWRFPDAGGYRVLPELHLACSGLSVKAAKEEWKQLGLGKKNLTIALDWMHQTFEGAPVLGSLINPRKSNAAKIVKWEELEGALNQALTTEQDEEKKEAGIVAQGLAKTATMLADEYHWVMTNVPYLGRGKQVSLLQDYTEKNYPAAKHDLATVFLDRCLELTEENGHVSIVMPQNWMFLTPYKKFRESLLKNHSFDFFARLGSGAFDTISGEVVKAILISLSKRGIDFIESNQPEKLLRATDVSDVKGTGRKSEELTCNNIVSFSQSRQLENPDMIIMLDEVSNCDLLELSATAFTGASAGDGNRFIRKVWELDCKTCDWEFHQSTVTDFTLFSGMSEMIYWQREKGEMFKLAESVKHLNHAAQSWLRGKPNWGRKGVVISQMGNLYSTNYTGAIYDCNCCAIVPDNEDLLAPLWAYCSSLDYHSEVRKLSQKLNVTPKTMLKVPFDLKHWTSVSQELYPNGLPLPFTDDPTQWVFHGHPCGSVIWNEEAKWTVKDNLRIDDTVLQVAVARLLGYQWPTELDPEMELAEEQREWVNACSALNEFVDDDGIACLPAIRGEKAAADRLEALLQAAYGEAWNANVLNELLASVKAKSLEAWLRDKFFDQHSKLFQHRPFIWQIWDGQADGFSALVNYHQFDNGGLQRLIYVYLDDWIRLQNDGVNEGVDGADIRLTAAEALKAKLEAILAGEEGLDIFVRWKSLAEQPIGWNPDLNDGVRLNIRPFMQAGDVGKKGAGVLRGKPNIHWKKDRGTDVESAPWFNLGEEYGEKLGSRINDHHLTLAEKQAARDAVGE